CDLAGVRRGQAVQNHLRQIAVVAQRLRLLQNSTSAITHLLPHRWVVLTARICVKRKPNPRQNYSIIGISQRDFFQQWQCRDHVLGFIKVDRPLTLSGILGLSCGCREGRERYESYEGISAILLLIQVELNIMTSGVASGAGRTTPVYGWVQNSVNAILVHFQRISS